jgi:hypothetical protein
MLIDPTEAALAAQLPKDGRHTSASRSNAA